MQQFPPSTATENLPSGSLLQRLPLAKLALRGSAWIMGGEAVSIGLRLVSSLALTRLLSPDLFGLVALAYLVYKGVSMFADMGLRGNVVYHQSGDDPAFLDTIWTIQIIKGLVVWLLVSMLAYPAALFYDAPDLVWLIPATSFAGVILGFQSTAVYSVVRHVQQKRKVLFEVAAKLIGFVVMLLWAWIAPSVAALVSGGLATALVTCVLSRKLLPGRRPDHWGMDREKALQIIRYGRWILVSTALTFLFIEADKLVLGKILDVSELGIYTIAALACVVVLELVTRLSTDVLFPLYSKIVREPQSASLLDTARIRLAIAALGCGPMWIFGLYGEQIISWLYDSRYHAAGEMVQILAIGAIAQLLTATSERMLLAQGNSYVHMWSTAIRTLLVFSCMAAGGYLSGVTGLLYGLVVARWLGWLVVSVILVKQKAIVLRVDFTLIVASAAVLLLGGWEP